VPHLAISLAVLLLAAAQAGADTQGATGAVVGLQHNRSNSDSSATYNGLLWVETNGALQQYGWGGAVCGTSFIADDVGVLQGALDNARILIQPFWKAGTGGARCLVAYRLIRRDWAGLF
jgi:hypothetical protein